MRRLARTATCVYLVLAGLAPALHTHGTPSSHPQCKHEGHFAHHGQPDAACPVCAFLGTAQSDDAFAPVVSGPEPGLTSAALVSLLPSSSPVVSVFDARAPPLS